MADKRVNTTAELHAVTEQITFGPSGVMLDKMDLRWEVEVLVNVGWRIRFTFLRPDNETGVMGQGAGRWELIEAGATESSVVKTCWLLLELLVRHELMEAFMYRGVRLFDPHRTVDDLSLPRR